MSVRNLEPYLPKAGLPEGSFCKRCGVVYHNKRWQLEHVPSGVNSQEVLCPACSASTRMTLPAW